ncbi:MAG: HAMP domain-containing histidine kinase [Oscillospiraceae bacterium]|nr:HAMP domain-containing histidine kinase [Oscillospiraceae bacterium]
MSSEKTAIQREARGDASLERKLTRGEIWRRFALLLSTDILIIAMFLCALIIHSEITVKNAANLEGIGVIPTISDSRPNGFTLPGQVSSRLIGEPEGIVRNLYFGEPFWGDGGVILHPFLANLRSLTYLIASPVNGEYYIATFGFASAITLFQHTFAVLLVLQAIGLITEAFEIRKSIRRTLRPIYELTLAAQTVHRNTAPQVPLKPHKLQLSGAIDTLNTIDENELSRRIVISDEREELKGLAFAINSMLDRLDAAYSSQLRFVSDASHELRTPIAVIQGYANMLDRWGKNDTDTLQESIDAIKYEAAGMQDLVEQLLFLARSDNRSIALNIETVNLTALADEVFRETRMIDSGHEYHARLTDGLSVRGDMQLLKQAVRIFMDNAIKYTPSGGMITISTLDEDGHAKISVTDNGLGIPPDDLEKIFERFFRSDESRTRETGGTGLGLSIAKWIIDRHGGFVEVTSRVDIGTKITAALPKFSE